MVPQLQRPQSSQLKITIKNSNSMISKESLSTQIHLTQMLQQLIMVWMKRTFGLSENQSTTKMLWQTPILKVFGRQEIWLINHGGLKNFWCLLSTKKIRRRKCSSSGAWDWDLREWRWDKLCKKLKVIKNKSDNLKMKLESM